MIYPSPYKAAGIPSGLRHEKRKELDFPLPTQREISKLAAPKSKVRFCQECDCPIIAGEAHFHRRLIKGRGTRVSLKSDRKQ